MPLVRQLPSNTIKPVLVTTSIWRLPVLSDHDFHTAIQWYLCKLNLYSATTCLMWPFFFPPLKSHIRQVWLYLSWLAEKSLRLDNSNLQPRPQLALWFRRSIFRWWLPWYRPLTSNLHHSWGSGFVEVFSGDGYNGTALLPPPQLALWFRQSIFRWWLPWYRPLTSTTVGALVSSKYFPVMVTMVPPSYLHHSWRSGFVKVFSGNGYHGTALLPPTSTTVGALVSSKYFPVMVTMVPPSKLPTVGETDLISAYDWKEANWPLEYRCSILRSLWDLGYN